MEKDRICKYCNKEFKSIEGRLFSNHIRWCDKNPQRNKGLDKISKSLKKKYESINGKMQLFIVNCSNNKCNKEFKIEEPELKFPKKDKYFCSRSCANTRKHSNFTKKKIKNALLKPRIRQCFNCNKEFSMHDRRGKYCSDKCISIKRKENLTEFNKYKSMCKFKFNLSDYPDKFDFTLIEKYGWYSASNKGNNLEGISRDHMISIKYGFENNIDPNIISHPANCKLMKHSDNISKNKRCSITLEELLNKIKNW
jgi:hypothetical protein